MGADRPQLHLWHERQPKGCRLPSSRRLPERDRQCDHFRARPRFSVSLDLADVPLQWLDLPLGSDGGGRYPCVSASYRSGDDLAAIAEHRITHLCGAPIVLNMLAHAPDTIKRRFDHVVEIATGGAAPPSAVIEAMERMGFRVTHLYGLTESYGPSTVCAWQEEWAGLSLGDRSARMARQGVAYPTLDRQRVVDPQTMTDVPADGRTLGELVLRSNTVMKGYLKNPAATEAAFEHGWFHTGDLAVTHPDGYVEIKDRSKDIIISGGENISS